MDIDAPPLWINRPPAPTEFAGVRLIRVGAGKSLQAIVTSDHLIGANTHFAKRRTQPCIGPECSLCLDAVPARWHGYLSICSTQNKTPFVLELTTLAAAPVADYDDRKGSLRGALLIATRTGNRPNSPVTVTITPSDVDLRTLPRAVDLERFLCTIWSVPLRCDDDTGKPHPGPNIRNTPNADPSGSTAQSLPPNPAQILSDAINGNGRQPNDAPPDARRFHVVPR